MLDLKHLLSAIAIFAAVCFLYLLQSGTGKMTSPASIESGQPSESAAEALDTAGAVGISTFPETGSKDVEAKSSQSQNEAPAAVDEKKLPSQPEKSESKADKGTKKTEKAKGRQEPVSPSQHGTIKVGLVIDDFGHSEKIAKQIQKMGLTATWAVIPGTPDARKVADLACQAGQPFLVHLPMQAVSDKDGSSEYLIGVDTPPERIRSYVEKFRSKFPEAVGVNNHRGSKATSDRPTMEAFMSAMAETDWGFLDSRTIGKSVAKKVAQEYHIPTAENRIFIDGTTDLSTMKKRFSEALRMGRKNGSVIAICHARVTTLPFLRYVSKTDFGQVDFVTVDKLWK